MQFDNSNLVVEQNNYATKIVNVYIVYDLDTGPKVLLINFKLKIACLVQLIRWKMVMEVSGGIEAMA